MSNRSKLPVALTIAGSDSGAGAGIQADLKTFAALGVHGTNAITCVTAQNPAHVSAIESCRPMMVRKQIEAVLAGFHPVAAKTGMLHSAAIIRAVIESLRAAPKLRLIVDPVLISTSGTRLLQRDAIKILRSKLLPRATLVTPNLDEAALLAGMKLRDVEDMRSSVRILHDEFGCAVLVKGGHLPGGTEAVDIFYDGTTELLLSAPFIKGLRTHGTGCTYSSAITAYLALGFELADAVIRAKEHITQTIAHSQTANGHPILNNFWRRDA